MSKKDKLSLKFINLVEIMHKLRSRTGCPWDREQTRHSLKPYLIEEAYEVLDALDKNDNDSIKEELGDLLLQIIFHAEIAAEDNLFTIEEVIDEITNKLIRRHPHVFAKTKLKTSKEVLANWNKIKFDEKSKSSRKPKSVLGEYPKSLPILHKISRITDKASKVGFDWPNSKSVLEKIEEELNELKAEIKSGKKDKMEDEIGDLLFSVINLSRILDINPEIALRSTLNKFMRRFHFIEKTLKKKKLSFDNCDINFLEKLWQDAKKKET